MRAWAGLSMPQILTAIAIDRRALTFPDGTPPDFKVPLQPDAAQGPRIKLSGGAVRVMRSLRVALCARRLYETKGVRLKVSRSQSVTRPKFPLWTHICRCWRRCACPSSRRSGPRSRTWRQPSTA